MPGVRFCVCVCVCVTVQVILVHSNGEMSVTNNPDVLTASGKSAANVPRTVAQAAAAATRPPTFTLRPVLSAVSAQASGVGGGSSVTVTLAEEGGSTFDVQHPEANRVRQGFSTVAAQPAPFNYLSCTTEKARAHISLSCWCSKSCDVVLEIRRLSGVGTRNMLE
jgi:hypothetical protein